MFEKITEIKINGLDKLSDRIFRDFENEMYETLAAALMQKGIFATKETIKEIFEKAHKYDVLGEVYGLQSLEGIKTKYGDQCAKYRSKLDRIREILEEEEC